jgi:hypothetical protein
MFYNRVYFTSRQLYCRIKHRSNYNRTFTTTTTKNGTGGGGGGGGGPNWDAILTLLISVTAIYTVDRL